LTQELFASAGSKATRAFSVLVPEVVFWLMASCALGDGAMAGAIVLFWSSVRDFYRRLPLEPVTEEAFCKARRLLSIEFFRRLFSSVVARFDKKFGSRFCWHGFRLHGIDGTELGLPGGAKKLLEAFPPPSNQHGTSTHPQALLVGLVDLFGGICRRFELVSLKVGEQAAAKAIVSHLGPGDLLLGDKNFPKYEILARIRQRGAHFLMRLRKGDFVGEPYPRTYLTNPKEWLITLKISSELKKECPDLPTTLRVRILQYQLPGFEPSYLITSLLDAKRYPYEEIVTLYHDRWRHETRHDEWKNTLQISNLRSKSPEGILKEVFVQLTLNNVLRWMMADATPPPGQPVDLKFRACKRLVMAEISRMAQAPLSDLLPWYESLKLEIAQRRILVRPGRSYPRRKNEAQGRNKGHGKIIPPAKLQVPPPTQGKGEPPRSSFVGPPSLSMPQIHVS
jgi:hypothetical protein